MATEGDTAPGGRARPSARVLIEQRTRSSMLADLFALTRQLTTARWGARADGSPPQNPARTSDGQVISGEVVDDYLARLRAAETSLRNDVARIDQELDTL